MKFECQGTVVGLEEVEKDQDEVRCLIWFDGMPGDNTQIKIIVPAGCLNLRQDLLVTVEPLAQLDRPETTKVKAGWYQETNSEDAVASTEQQ